MTIGRIDRAGRVIAAPPEAVYGALLDRTALESRLPPDGPSFAGTITMTWHLASCGESAD